MRTLAAALAATLLAALIPALAQAGRYHVYSCRTPSGAPAPVDGWSGSIAPGSAYDDYVKDTCPEGGALIAALGDATSHLAYADRATWALEVPSFAAVVGATLWRAGYLHGAVGEDASYEFWLSGPLLKDVFEECVYSKECHGLGEPAEATGAANRVDLAPKYLGAHIYLSASCGAGLEGSECGAAVAGPSRAFTDPNNYAAALYLYAADLTLEQEAGPAVSDVAGELASAPVLAGPAAVTFQAADPGSGVYEALVSIDGAVVQRTVLDEAGGRCRDVGGTTDGLPAFLYLQPCPASVSADVAFDPSGLAPGAHHLVVTVTDAAGNAAPVLDRTITIPGPAAGGAAAAAAAGSPNGVGASPIAILRAHWRGVAGPRLVAPYGRRETILGRLTGIADAPIAGAQIAVTETPQLAGAAAVSMRPVTTDADGYFRLTLPARVSSRSVRLSYDARIGEAQPAASATVILGVRAPVSLSVAPRHATAGTTIHFAGRLLAGPFPRGGKPVVLEARSGRGAWIEFHVVRADSHGRYRFKYRFRLPGPARYQFRVFCEQEADYPFSSGASATVTVGER